jgi:hypothetical protein
MILWFGSDPSTQAITRRQDEAEASECSFELGARTTLVFIMSWPPLRRDAIGVARIVLNPRAITFMRHCPSPALTKPGQPGRRADQ